jgi:hypothetical protein
MIRAQSVYNFLNKKYEELPFTGAWYDAFNKPAPSGTWFFYGDSTNGKTSMLQQMAQYFSEELRQRVAYMSLEEYGRPSFQKSARRTGWKEKGSLIQILPPASPDELDEWLEKHNNTKLIIIDTINYWILKYNFSTIRYFKLKEKFPDKIFAYMSHVKGNEPDRAVAVDIMRDADQKVFIQGFRAISKGRSTGTKGYYTIWEEGEKKIWLTEK